MLSGRFTQSIGRRVRCMFSGPSYWNCFGCVVADHTVWISFLCYILLVSDGGKYICQIWKKKYLPSYRELTVQKLWLLWLLNLRYCSIPYVYVYNSCFPSRLLNFDYFALVSWIDTSSLSKSFLRYKNFPRQDVRENLPFFNKEQFCVETSFLNRWSSIHNTSETPNRSRLW